MKFKMLLICVSLLVVASVTIAARNPCNAKFRYVPAADCVKALSVPANGYLIIRDPQTYCDYWDTCETSVLCDPNVVNWKKEILIILFDEHFRNPCGHYGHAVDCVMKVKRSKNIVIEGSYIDNSKLPCCSCSCGIGSEHAISMAIAVSKNVITVDELIWNVTVDPCCTCP